MVTLASPDAALGGGSVAPVSSFEAQESIATAIQSILEAFDVFNLFSLLERAWPGDTLELPIGRARSSLH